MTTLNQYEILKNVTPTWWYVVLVVLTVSVVALTVSVVALIAIEKETGSNSLLLAIVLTIIFGLIWALGVKPIVTKEDIPTGRYRYECTIDDDASFVDIAEKYVVVEQRGDLWILEDKDET